MHFWTQDPAAAARAVQSLCPQAAAAALARADEICRREFIFQDHWEMEPTCKAVRFSDGMQWDAVPFGDPEWTYALNRHTIFVNLAKAWLFTGKDCYLEAFSALLTDWLDRVPHTPKNEAATWRALEAGLRAENWLRAAELFGDAMPQPLRLRMDESLREHGEYLLRAHGAFQRLSNWGAIQAHGLLLIGLHLHRADWQALAIERLTENLHNAVLPDGVQWEQSPMYHCEVLHAAADALMLSGRCGVAVPPALKETVHAMFRALSVWVAPDRTILPQSDSDCIDAGDLLAQGALLFRDPQLAAAAQGTLCEETLWDFGCEAPALLSALPALRPACPSQALSESGNYLLRSGWGVQDTFLHLHSGSLGGGHGHADLLHIDLWHGGEAVLIDPGRYTYVDSPLRAALKSPTAHNTFRVDGQDFTRYRGTWEWAPVAQPLPTEARFAPQADYLCAGHLGYAAQGVTVQRKLLLLKPDLLIGVDLLFAPDGTSHTVEQYFHFGTGTLHAEGTSAFWNGSRTYAQLHALCRQALRRIPSPRAPLYNTLQDGPALCLRTETGAFAALAFVLSLGAPCSAQLLPVTDASGRTLAEEDAQAVRIEKNGERYTAIFCHRAGAHNAALLCAGGCTGHGNTLVFTPQNPQGICLS